MAVQMHSDSHLSLALIRHLPITFFLVHLAPYFLQFKINVAYTPAHVHTHKADLSTVLTQSTF